MSWLPLGPPPVRRMATMLLSTFHDGPYVWDGSTNEFDMNLWALLDNPDLDWITVNKWDDVLGYPPGTFPFGVVTVREPGDYKMTMHVTYTNNCPDGDVRADSGSVIGGAPVPLVVTATPVTSTGFMTVRVEQWQIDYNETLPGRIGYWLLWNVNLHEAGTFEVTDVSLDVEQLGGAGAVPQWLPVGPPSPFFFIATQGPDAPFTYPESVIAQWSAIPNATDVTQLRFTPHVEVVGGSDVIHGTPFTLTPVEDFVGGPGSGSGAGFSPGGFLDEPVVGRTWVGLLEVTTPSGVTTYRSTEVTLAAGAGVEPDPGPPGRWIPLGVKTGPTPLVLFLIDKFSDPAQRNDPNGFARSTDQGSTVTVMSGLADMRRVFALTSYGTTVVLGGLGLLSENTPSTARPLAVSTDQGASWTVMHAPILDVQSIATDGSTWLAGGDPLSAAPYYSLVRSTGPAGPWTGVETPLDSGTTTVLWTGRVWVVLFEQATHWLATSPDTSTWTERDVPTDVTGTGSRRMTCALALDGDILIWLSMGSAAYLARSSDDGATWTVTACDDGSGSQGRISHALWADNHNVFFANGTNSGENTVLSSPDGITWTRHQTAAGVQFSQAVGYDGEFFYVGGQTNEAHTTFAFARSRDLVTWGHPGVPQDTVQAWRVDMIATQLVKGNIV